MSSNKKENDQNLDNQVSQYLKPTKPSEAKVNIFKNINNQKILSEKTKVSFLHVSSLMIPQQNNEQIQRNASRGQKYLKICYKKRKAAAKIKKNEEEMKNISQQLKMKKTFQRKQFDEYMTLRNKQLKKMQQQKIRERRQHQLNCKKAYEKSIENENQYKQFYKKLSKFQNERLEKFSSYISPKRKRKEQQEKDLMERRSKEAKLKEEKAIFKK